MTAELCPHCGAPRQPGSRFCGTCAFDYWKAAESAGGGEASPPTEQPPAEQPPAVAWHPDSKPPRSPLRIALIVVGVLVVLGVIGVLSQQPGTVGESPAGAAQSQDATPDATPNATPDATPRPTATPAPTRTPSLVCGPGEHISLTQCVPNTPAPTPIPVTYVTPAERDWALIMRSPDDYLGNAYQVYGCITQFDAATGPDSFRAEASYQNEAYWYLDGENVYFTGTRSQLADYVQDDVVLMDVISLGSYTYDTQIGGSTTVPIFSIDIISHQGSC